MLLPPDLVDALGRATDTLDAETVAQGYRHDPVRWVSDKLGEHLWSKQVEIAHALQAHRRVAVKSAHGTGKSHCASRLVAHWLETVPPGEGFVVTTAPSTVQVGAILWRYIGQAHLKGKLRGRILTTEWKLGRELVAFGRKPPDSNDAEGRAVFQGIHSKFVLVVIDEAGGVPEWLWTSADALTTNEGCCLLAIGNPADPSSHFAQVCQPGSGWHVIQISAFDSPNFTGEEVPDDLRGLLVSRSWVEEKRHEWGEDHPYWAEKVLGEFPAESEWQVVKASALARCRIPRDGGYSPADLLPVVLGVDVGAGGDETVIRERRGRMAAREWRQRSKDTMDAVKLVVDVIGETGATCVNVDATGIGAGVADRLAEMHGEGKHGARIVKVYVGMAASDPKTFANLRAEIWWEIGRLGSERGEWDLAAAEVDQYGQWLSGMVDPETTCAQLLTPHWHKDSKGRILIESKDDMRQRIDRSPDNADALCLAFHVGTSVFDAHVAAMLESDDDPTAGMASMSPASW